MCIVLYTDASFYYEWFGRALGWLPVARLCFWLYADQREGPDAPPIVGSEMCIRDSCLVCVCNTIRPTIRGKGTSDPCNTTRPTIRPKGTSDARVTQFGRPSEEKVPRTRVTQLGRPSEEKVPRTRVD